MIQKTEISCIFLKKVFLRFPEMELSSLKSKKFRKGAFWAQKIKNTPLWKNFLYFRKWNFIASSSYISGENLQSLKIKNCKFLFVERELFKQKYERKKFLRLSLIKKQNFLLIHVLRQVNAMSFCSIVFIANLGIPINTIEQKHTTFILIDLLL